MKSKAVVIHADTKPMRGIANPRPNQLYQDPRVSTESRELEDLDPHDIRVEMVYAGLCGTDVHLAETNPDTGYIRCSAPAEIPREGRIIGHEGVGKIIEVGSYVQHIEPDRYVTFESIIVCNSCDRCRQGRFNQCRHARLLGLQEDGLFATVVDVPAQLVHDVGAIVNDDKDMRAVACIEPAAVAYVACVNARISPGDVVAVFGAGPIGLFSAILSKVAFGASTVHMIEPAGFRRRLARKWSDKVYEIDEFFHNCPPFIDVIIEASGELENIRRVIHHVDANGRIALLARSGESLALDSVDHMITNAISLIGSRGHLGGAFNAILRLYEAGLLPLEEVVTDVVNGPEELCDLLRSPDTIIHENCKILVKLN